MNNTLFQVRFIHRGFADHPPGHADPGLADRLRPPGPQRVPGFQRPAPGAQAGCTAAMSCCLEVDRVDDDVELAETMDDKKKRNKWRNTYKEKGISLILSDR